MKKILCIFMCIALLSGLLSCEMPPAKQSINTFEYFDTVSTFSDYSGLSENEFERLSSDFKSELRTYHELYDIYNEYEGITNIATLNRLAGCGPQLVDKKIVDMLLFAKEMYNLTSGKVNVAMGAVLEIWHEYRDERTAVPPMELLRAAAEHTDINDIVIDEINMTVELSDSEMSLDVGAVAKGYAVEMIASNFEARGYTSLVIDVGGNLRVGKKPSGKGWSAGVQNPSDFSEIVYKTELKNEAMVTSGDYQRYYTVDGVRYHHIINGETLIPSAYYRSVSIVADSSALADALSTAVFNMEYEEAKKFIGTLQGVTAVLVFPDGRVEEISGN